MHMMSNATHVPATTAQLQSQLSAEVAGRSNEKAELTSRMHQLQLHFQGINDAAAMMVCGCETIACVT